MKIYLRLLAAVAAPFITAETPKTNLLAPGKLVCQEGFSGGAKIAKPRWWIKQNTQWAVEDGVLVGRAATEAYQEERRKVGHHLGDVPRIGLGKMPPKSYVMSFRFQVDDKPGDAKVPMFEFGHHVSRVYFGTEGAMLLSSHQKKTHQIEKGYTLKPFSWYQVLAEVGETELVVQITDDEGKSIVLQGADPKFKQAEKRSFGIATTKQGVAKLDDVKIWESKGKN